MVGRLSYDRASDILGFTPRTIVNWVRRFRDGGIEALRDKPRSGRPWKIPKDEVKGILERSPRDLGYQYDAWFIY